MLSNNPLSAPYFPYLGHPETRRVQSYWVSPTLSITRYLRSATLLTWFVHGLLHSRRQLWEPAVGASCGSQPDRAGNRARQRHPAWLHHGTRPRRQSPAGTSRAGSQEAEPLGHPSGHLRIASSSPTPCRRRPSRGRPQGMPGRSRQRTAVPRLRDVRPDARRPCARTRGSNRQARDATNTVAKLRSFSHTTLGTKGQNNL